MNSPRDAFGPIAPSARMLAFASIASLVACGGGSAKGSSSPSAAPVGVSTAQVVPSDDVTKAKQPRAPESATERAARLHREAIIVDGHNDIPTVMLGTRQELGDRLPDTHTDLPRMKAGGITGEFFSIYVEGDLETKPTVRGGGSLRRAIDLIDVTYRQVERNPKDLLLATSAADIRRAKKEGKIAILMGIEGGHAIENSLYTLRGLYRLGCRYMTLTHTNTNEWADSAGSSGPTPTRHHGLSPFGEEVVQEMQRIGMLVDISHVADDTFWAVMKSAKAPVIASHSSARAIADHRRNLNDDMLRALAKNGGVAMVNFWSLFLSADYQAAQRAWFEKHGKAVAELRARYHDDPAGWKRAREKLRAETEPLPKVPLSMLVDHIEHMVKVAGVDHVGLGSDFDGVDDLPQGITGIDDLPKLTLALVERGYKDDEILKILGGNFLRVFEEAEKYASSTGTTLSGDGDTTRIDAMDRKR